MIRIGIRGAVAALAAAAAVAVTLTACGALPTSGPVNAGQPIADDSSAGDLVFLPDAPAKDATPQQIVEGFIAAGSGPRDNWAIAHLYLAPEFSSEWDPREGVAVYDPGERALTETAEDEFVLLAGDDLPRFAVVLDQVAEAKLRSGSGLDSVMMMASVGSISRSLPRAAA